MKHVAEVDEAGDVGRIFRVDKNVTAMRVLVNDLMAKFSAVPL